MDDLMNKVGALIEEHVKSEVRARNELGWPTLDEIRRGERALGFWEKLVEALSGGRVEDATFDCVMEKIGALKERCDEFDIMRKDRDGALALSKEHLIAIDNLRATLAERSAIIESLTKERDQALQNYEWMRKDRDESNRAAGKYRTMWEQLHRAQSEDLDAQHQLKEPLSTIGLAHFDRNTITGAIEATRKRDARLCSERNEAKAQLEVACAKVRELDAKLLEVRKAVDEKAQAVDSERHYEGDELEGFRVGDLVQLRGMHPPHVRWQTVTKLEEDGRVRYAPCDAYAPHMIARKPIEVGDAVRWKNEAARRDSRGMARYVVTRVDGRHCWFGVRGAELCDVIAVAP